MELHLARATQPAGGEPVARAHAKSGAGSSDDATSRRAGATTAAAPAQTPPQRHGRHHGRCHRGGATDGVMGGATTDRHAAKLLQDAAAAKATALAAGAQAAAATYDAAQRARGGRLLATAPGGGYGGYGGGLGDELGGVAVPPHLQHLRTDLETRFPGLRATGWKHPPSLLIF